MRTWGMENRGFLEDCAKSGQMKSILSSGEWGASFNFQALLTLVLVFQADIVRGRQTEDALHHQDQVVQRDIVAMVQSGLPDIVSEADLQFIGVN